MITVKHRPKALTEDILLRVADGEDLDPLVDREGKRKVSRAMLTLMNKGWLRLDGISETGKAEAEKIRQRLKEQHG